MTDEEIGKRVREGKYVLYTFHHEGNGAMIPQFVMIGDRPFIGDVVSIEEERKRAREEE